MGTKAQRRVTRLTDQRVADKVKDVQAGYHELFVLPIDERLENVEEVVETLMATVERLDRDLGRTWGYRLRRRFDRAVGWVRLLLRLGPYDAKVIVPEPTGPIRWSEPQDPDSFEPSSCRHQMEDLAAHIDDPHEPCPECGIPLKPVDA
jgi:hypothetical protein